MKVQTIAVRNAVLGKAIAVAMLAAWLVCGPAKADEAENAAVLFAFDDHAIALRDNLRLTLVAADKHPANPVLRCGAAGSPDHGHAILYGSVIPVDGKFRMWYLGMSQRKIERGQAPGWWRPMCYAESRDGIHWVKPELGLVEFNGSRNNNICLIESDPPSLSRVNDFLSVLYEPGDPDPQRRYKCAFIAHPPFDEVRGGRSPIGPNESRWCSFVCATSGDGLRWKVVGDRPANSGGQRFEVSGLYRFDGFYYATGQLISPWTSLPDGRDVGRVMLAYRSGDFEHWSRASALAFARPGQTTTTPAPGQQTHMGAGLWSRNGVLIGLYGMWQDGPQEKPKGATHLWGTRIDLGLIVSSDGLHFREPVPDFKVIARGAEGQWDSIALLQGHAFANVGDKTYMWYSHWDCEGHFRSQEIGLATLRRDGFGYLARQHASAPGQLITATVQASSRAAPKLWVNVDGVSPKSPLTVEMLDDRDRPIAGFSGAAAAEVTQPGLQQRVHWPVKWEPLQRGTSRVAYRITFPSTGDARLYALYVVP